MPIVNCRTFSKNLENHNYQEHRYLHKCATISGSVCHVIFGTLRSMNPKTDIQKLLKLKRYEAPPSGFHENFLKEFRRRQRVDLLRRTLRPSVRQAFVERMSFFLTSLRV